MAFNLAQFDLTSFNIDVGNTRYIRALGVETVSSSIGSALQIYARAIGNERVNETANGAAGRFVKAKGTETIAEAVMNGQLSIILYPKFYETVSQETDIVAEIYSPSIFTETITADTTLGSNIYAYPIFSEEIDAVTAIGADIYPSAEGFELVSESASLEALELKTCTLTVTLKPGQRLIVDSSTYNILLDGENAIEIQSGDWIDELNRETTDIAITAASGVENLTASILYTERYL